MAGQCSAGACAHVGAPVGATGVRGFLVCRLDRDCGRPDRASHTRTHARTHPLQLRGRPIALIECARALGRARLRKPACLAQPRDDRRR